APDPESFFVLGGLGPVFFPLRLIRGTVTPVLALLLAAASSLDLADTCVGSPGLCELLGRAALSDLVLVLPAVHLGRALVHGVPPLDLVAEHVHVVVQ